MVELPIKNGDLLENIGKNMVIYGCLPSGYLLQVANWKPWPSRKFVDLPS